MQRRDAALIVEPLLRGAIGSFIVHEAPVRQDDAVADLIHGAVPTREATKPAQDSMLSGLSLTPSYPEKAPQAATLASCLLHQLQVYLVRRQKLQGSSDGFRLRTCSWSSLCCRTILLLQPVPV